MEISGQQIFEFLSQYGYWIMFPLMIIEGPVMTLIAAMLASLGAFNVFIVFMLSIAGDIIGDIGFYTIGRKWGLTFARGIGKYIGITEKRILKMERYFNNHGGKTIFLVKSTTGLCLMTFVAAGIVRMNIKKFLLFSFLGGIVWSGSLVSVGYFYGYLWREISQFIDWIGWIVFGLVIITFIIINLFKSYETKKLFNNSNSFTYTK